MSIATEDLRLPPARDGDGGLFPVYTAQIAGFVINPSGVPCALRWSVARDPECMWWSPAERTIRYKLPPPSVPLLVDALRTPSDDGIAVQCLLPDGGRRYVGTFDVTDVGPSEVVLTLRADRCLRGDSVPPLIVESDSPPLPFLVRTAERPIAAPDDSEKQSPGFISWLVRRGADIVLSDPAIAAPVCAVWYRALDPVAREWCGSPNRFGDNCVVWSVTDQYPDRTVFAAARLFASTARFPTVLCYGGDATTSLIAEEAVRVEVILFRPGSEETTRAHIAVSGDRHLLTLGELGCAAL